MANGDIELMIVSAASDGRPATRLRIGGEGVYRIGRDSNRNDIVIHDDNVSRRHAMIRVSGGRVEVIDDGSRNGTMIGEREVGDVWTSWPAGVELAVGNHVIVWQAAGRRAPARPLPREEQDDATSVVGGSRAYSEPGAPVSSRDRSPGRDRFPGALFERQIVPVHEIRASGLLAGETTYLALGAGIGSFTWVDHLRCYGVPTSDIRVIGVHPNAYDKWADYCGKSQIPVHERIRSNSISVPDNIWGFPGYASRETWRELKNGRINGLKYIWQVFGEPAVAETYTPRLGDVTRSIDREQQRIGWRDMLVFGRILALRKTDDGRYVVAYRVPADTTDSEDRDAYYIGRFVHIATGYPTTRYLDDLRDFKGRYPGSKQVVNAYEAHENVYQALEQRGGTVIVRGRGIVASRVLQRIYEARHRNANIRIRHIVRTPIRGGSKFGLARRIAKHDTEFQPFNWPKSCWGGVYRNLLEKSPPEERLKLLAVWGGTTTADRRDWLHILETGKAEGWYTTYYGEISKMKLKGDKVVTELKSKDGFNETVELEADFVIDCTGLIASLDGSSFLKDLQQTYNLPRNRVPAEDPAVRARTGYDPNDKRRAGFEVTNQFEIAGLRNGEGRVYAAGVVVQNGPHAAVDSFLGLQFAALRSVDHLYAVGAPKVRAMGPIRSFSQWLKWCAHTAP